MPLKGRSYGQGPKGYDYWPADEGPRKRIDGKAKFNWACRKVKENPEDRERLENWLKAEVLQGLRDDDLRFRLHKRFKRVASEA